MAQFYHGVNGAFSGKVGSVVGSSWGDIDYMRGLPKKTSKAPSAKQLAIRARMKLLAQFLLLVKKAVDRGYSHQAGKTAGALPLAVQANQAALTGTDLDPQLDYSKIELSKGLVIPKPFGCKITDPVPGELSISWQHFRADDKERMDDKATIVICCPEHKEAIVSIDNFARKDGVAALEIPGNWSNTTVYAYLFMTSADGQSSPTAYAGSLPVF